MTLSEQQLAQFDRDGFLRFDNLFDAAGAAQRRPPARNRPGVMAGAVRGGARWIRYEHAGTRAFGTLDGETIARYDGDMFGAPVATGETVALSDVKVLTPTEARKYICLWNNYAALGAKLGLAVPATPLFLLKASSSYAASGDVIRKPKRTTGA